MTWCVWMNVPGKHMNPWSRVAGELTQEQAEFIAEALYFTARAMPDRVDNQETTN